MLIGKAQQEEASIIVDGRNRKVKGYENGYFVFPTVLDQVPPESEIAHTEIFGPVLIIIQPFIRYPPWLADRFSYQVDILEKEVSFRIIWIECHCREILAGGNFSWKFVTDVA